MPVLSATIFPQLQSLLTNCELRGSYTPTPNQRHLTEAHTKEGAAGVAFLILLKVFQRLGYAVWLTAVPPIIVTHVADAVGIAVTTADLIGYDASGTRCRHLKIIREHLKLTAYSDAAQQVMERAMRDAAPSKEDLADFN